MLRGLKTFGKNELLLPNCVNNLGKMPKAFAISVLRLAGLQSKRFVVLVVLVVGDERLKYLKNVRL